MLLPATGGPEQQSKQTNYHLTTFQCPLGVPGRATSAWFPVVLSAPEERSFAAALRLIPIIGSNDSLGNCSIRRLEHLLLVHYALRSCSLAPSV